jgi:NADPH-dependent 2,4-dienoyl-CoA reductase/sulfur reductase-like enzyme
MVIGAGPAGLAAAAAAKDAGAPDVLLIEREEETGGILNQCIHDGFGLLQYGESFTGPEYAWKAGQNALRSGARVLSGAMATQITPDRTVTVSRRGGRVQYQAGALVLAMGCRERARGAIQLPGQRPAGIFTAGVAQALINNMNIMVGRKAVILGSGDIGLIMARRLTLEGAEVAAVLEKLPYPGGLPRNIRQCLTDYRIPLLLSHTVTEVLGRRRVDAVRVRRLDAQGSPVPGAEQIITCDTLILSVGLIPENELSTEAGVVLDPSTGGAVVDQYLHTNLPGVFACGNALHVHDLADYAAEEGAYAGLQAARFAALPRERQISSRRRIPVRGGPGLRYVLPQSLSFSGQGGSPGASPETLPACLPPESPICGATRRESPFPGGSMREYTFPEGSLREYTFPGASPDRLFARRAPLTFFLRAQAPHSDVRIVFRIRDQIVHSQNFRKINPPEMLRIEVPAEILDSSDPLESLEVCLDV